MVEVERRHHQRQEGQQEQEGQLGKCLQREQCQKCLHNQLLLKRSSI